MLLLAGMFGLPWTAASQWQDATEIFTLPGTTQASYLGTALSVADFNADGLDDITVANSDGTAVAYMQMQSGGYEPVHFIDGTEQVQGIAWFDADGDDDLDLLLTRRFAAMQLFLTDGNGLVESAAESGLPLDETWEARGIAVADYDADGDLDVYISMYHDGTTGLSENLLLNNNGLGFFTDVTADLGVGNGLQHTFQGSWLDFDADGDLDLWVINDRTIFPNAMYSNNGDGTFQEVGGDYGLDQQVFAMTATVGDPDNDGDYELFCSNVENEPNVYMDKDGFGFYNETGADLGLDGMQYSWGGCWVDVDGDMDSDLMVATYRFPNTLPYKNYYYENHNGGATFTDMTESNWPNNQTQLYSLAACDFNQDLAPDLVALGNSSYLQMLQNDAVDGPAPNGRLAVQLCGTYSNRWAIGAEVKVHAGGVSQLQLVSCGTDYVTQQSWRRYFGLGSAEVVDSIEVNWPSGMHEVWYDVPVGSDLRLIEGSSTAVLSYSGTGCAGDSSWLNFPLPCPDVEVNGLAVLGDSMLIQEDGMYVVNCKWMGGLFQWSDTLFWTEQEPHGLSIQWTEPLCYNEPGSLGWYADSTFTVELEGNSFPFSVQNLQVLGGDLTLMTLDSASVCSELHHFTLVQPSELELYIDYAPALCHSDSAQAFAVGYGGTPNYILTWGNVNPLMLPEGTVPLHLEDANGCTVDSSIVVEIPAPLSCDVVAVPEDVGNDGSVELDPSGGTPPYEVIWNTGATGDTVLSGLSAGLYSWVIQDANGCLLLGLQALINMGVEEHALHRTGSLSRGPAGIWLKPGDPWPGILQVDFYDPKGSMVYSTSIENNDWHHWSWDLLPIQGVVWVHDTRGTTYLRSNY